MTQPPEILFLQWLLRFAIVLAVVVCIYLRFRKPAAPKVQPRKVRKSRLLEHPYGSPDVITAERRQAESSSVSKSRPVSSSSSSRRSDTSSDSAVLSSYDSYTPSSSSRSHSCSSSSSSDSYSSSDSSSSSSCD